MHNFFPFGYYNIPRFYDDLDVPPTLYALMQSLVNYKKEPKTKIRDLAKNARDSIFDFDYPLSQNVSRETFEINILNYFIKRRIGSQTFTSWQIDLCSRLNEIMPKYNVLFDSLNGWNLFKDGFTIEKTGESNDNKEDLSTSESSTNAQMNTNSRTKMRHSDLPQSQLQDIDDESYVNIYENNDTKNDSDSNSQNKTESKGNQKSKNTYTEVIKQSQSDLASQYITFQNNVNSIYTLIYKDLECLFYGLV